MSATAKQRSEVNARARELWQVAESGDAGELDHVLARGANINARNQHGMTALMKAAAHGHATMVRALLEHGADPNLARHDRFTALALAAFFGHTETVEILIEHGARIDVTTRCGASAQTWAARRTFEETAQCLEGCSVQAPAHVTKPLTDPPEIWDLVQEVPHGGFKARSAFVSRLKSMHANVALRFAAVLIVSIASIVGVFFFRGPEARSFPGEGEGNENVVVNEDLRPAPVSETKSEPRAETVTREVAGRTHHTESPPVVDKPSRRVVVTRPAKLRADKKEEPEESVPATKVSDVTPTAPKPQIEPRRTPERVNAGLSPQLITPAKDAAKKAKVIQWP